LFTAAIVAFNAPQSKPYAHIAQGEPATLQQNPSSGRLQGKDVILEYYRRYNAGDVDGVMELMAPDCQCEHLYIPPKEQQL
jgi:hypothetical protein